MNLPPNEFSTYDNIRRIHRQSLPQRSMNLAVMSLHLESVAASFVVEALTFFTNLETDWRWDNLRLLSLTSRFLRPGGDIDKTHQLLLHAARAAERMPNLQTMELWNGEERLAGLFQYHTEEGAATLLWRGTWNLDFPAEVVRAWEMLFPENVPLCLRIKPPELLEAGTIGSHGDAIVALDLKIPVARPVSVQQIQWEWARLRKGSGRSLT